jgi:predicted phage terminase large subunit-like protein
MLITLPIWKEMRQRGRTSLLYLCKAILGYKDVCPQVHGNLIRSLQEFEGGEDEAVGKSINGKPSPGSFPELINGYKPFIPNMWDLEGSRERLILIPRNHLKTSVATIAHTIQWIINYPDVRILLSSGTGDQVKGFLRAIKEHFQTNETFRYFYPEFVPHGKAVKEFGNQEMFTVPCRRLIRPEPTVNTLSVGSVVAGAHYDVIKHDDMVDKENCRTPEQIQTVKNHYGMLDPLLQRVEPTDTRRASQCRGWTDVIGTRYDYSDLYGTIIDGHRKTIESGKTSDWHILEQSAIVSGDLSDPEHCVTLWPDRFPPSELLRIANDPTRGWPHLSSQYLMNPRSDKDGLLESENEIVWVPPDAVRKIYAYLNLHVTVDLAGMEPSTNKLSDNDYTVINLHGFGHDGSLYILSILRGRYTPFEVIDLLFKLASVHPRLLDIKVEKEAHARVLLPFLKREMAKRGKYLPIVEIRRDNRTSKQQRIKGLQPWFRNGSIRFADNQPHKLAIIDEIMRFPRYAHDDILDTIADAMQNRDGGITIEVTPMDKQQNDYIEMSQKARLPDGSVSIANLSPDLKNLMDRIWGQDQEQEHVTVDSVTGW